MSYYFAKYNEQEKKKSIKNNGTGSGFCRLPYTYNGLRLAKYKFALTALDAFQTRKSCIVWKSLHALKAKSYLFQSV
jgi:hypothetical protein